MAIAGSSASGGKARFGAFEFDLHTGELRKHGLRIKLQGQPIDVLLMLLGTVSLWGRIIGFILFGVSIAG